MGAKDLRRERTVRRICEGVVATAAGGLIVWSVTSSMSQPPPTTERMAVAVASAVPPTAAPTASYIAGEPAPGQGPKIYQRTPEDQPTTCDRPIMSNVGINNFPSLAGAAPSPGLPQRIRANLSVPAALPSPSVATPPPKEPTAGAPSPTWNQLPYSIPVGSLLWYENFSHIRDGAAADWGPNTFIKTGPDRRNWLVSNIEGTHPVGCRIRLPNECYLECRYSAYMPEVTRGLLGWWKDPVSTKISFLNDQGDKYVIEWVIKCGNDATRPTLASSSLCAKKYYHTVTLPDGTTNEVGVIQPTGMLRIDRDKNVVKVFVDGQTVVAGTMSLKGQLVGFEIDVVKAKNGSLFFTDFKIAR